ncbi:hypothetical protein GW7_21187 [Heterocephalus glaber]|uniref:Uncharacterized protein n=1 Tax=Heterocephalus glaber TaxID=10181 RepID=G5AYQ8_HETGA|nr:hypothetical protein GW7_21187 [Heterocephalus glaber]
MEKAPRRRREILPNVHLHWICLCGKLRTPALPFSTVTKKFPPSPWSHYLPIQADVNSKLPLLCRHTLYLNDSEGG